MPKKGFGTQVVHYMIVCVSVAMLAATYLVYMSKGVIGLFMQSLH